jgi:hypothetical protein
MMTESPEVMLVWRLAIQMDQKLAIGDQNPIFAPISNQNDNHRRWLERIINRSYPEMVDIVLAQFALDDILNER